MRKATFQLGSLGKDNHLYSVPTPMLIALLHCWGFARITPFERRTSKFRNRFPPCIINIHLNLPFTLCVSDRPEDYSPGIYFGKANRRGCIRHQGSIHQEYAVNRKYRLTAPDKSQIEAGLTFISLKQGIQYTGIETSSGAPPIQFNCAASSNGLLFQMPLSKEAANVKLSTPRPTENLSVTL